MKKHILLSIVLGLGLLFLSNSAKSQNFQIVASFGTAQNWAVPNAVLYEIDYYYPYHQIVHINRERRGRNIFFNVLLEDRGQFVEVFFGRQAIIVDINYYHNYPLAQHVCSGHCGYHGNFYRSHQVVCNHRNHGGGHHNGHNHIAYRSGRNYNSYASKNGAANRNVRATYRSSNERNYSDRNSSKRSSVSRNDDNKNPNIRSSNSDRVRSNKNSRIGNSSSRSNASVRASKNSRSNSDRNSRNAVAYSSKSRN